MHTNVRCFFGKKKKEKKEKKRGGGGRRFMITAWAGSLVDVVGLERYSYGDFFAYPSIL